MRKVFRVMMLGLLLLPQRTTAQIEVDDGIDFVESARIDRIKKNIPELKKLEREFNRSKIGVCGITAAYQGTDDPHGGKLTLSVSRHGTGVLGLNLFADGWLDITEDQAHEEIKYTSPSTRERHIDGMGDLLSTKPNYVMAVTFKRDQTDTKEIHAALYALTRLTPKFARRDSEPFWDIDCKIHPISMKR